MLRDFLSGKPVEFWLILVGMTLYVASRDAEKEPIRRRITKTAASILLTLGFAERLADAAPWMGETGAAVIIMTVGLILLDVATALVQDRQFVKDLILKKLGGGR